MCLETQTTYANKITTLALLSAMSVALMFVKVSVPVMPSFLKLDMSDVPALIAAFSVSTGSGVIVIFIKNLFSAFLSSTMGIGELCNFIVGAAFVFTCGFIYNKHKTKKGAILAMLCGTLVMSVIAVFANYFIIIPMYSLVVPMDLIINMCKVINKRVDSLFKIVIAFILPFNIIKGFIVSTVTFIVYKKISPVIKKIKN